MKPIWHVESKIFTFNNISRVNFSCNNKIPICKDIPLKYIKLIPGYDNCIECLMEYTIIKDYLNDTLVLSDELLTTLNNYYYDIEFKDYIFMPIIIFIIKKLIANAL